MKDHSIGEKNGQKFGMKLSTVVKDAEEIKTNNFYATLYCQSKHSKSSLAWSGLVQFSFSKLEQLEHDESLEIEFFKVWLSHTL